MLVRNPILLTLLLSLFSGSSNLRIVEVSGFVVVINNNSYHHHTFLNALNIDQVESDAVNAAEMWDISSTPFLSGDDSDLVKSRLGDRGDILCAQIPTDTSKRCKYVFTNIELEIDPNEYCNVLQVENVSLGNCDPWPNMLDSIGIELNNVGDVITTDDKKMTFLVVDPSVTKTISRLLPKVLSGTGVSISIADLSDLPASGLLHDMEIQRLDKRQQKR